MGPRDRTAQVADDPKGAAAPVDSGGGDYPPGPTLGTMPHHLGRPANTYRSRHWPSEPVSAPDARLRGSAAILAHLDSTYGATRLAPGSLVLAALDEHSMLLGLGRWPVTPADLSLRVALVAVTVAEMVADGRGAATAAVLLVSFRSGGPRRCADDEHWWAALRRACRLLDLIPVDVVVSTPGGWATLRAGTAGAAVGWLGAGEPDVEPGLPGD